MSVNLNAVPAAAITMTLRKGSTGTSGADTALTVSLNGAQKGTDADPAHKVFFRRGDWFSVKCVAGALGVSTIDGTVTLRFVKPGTNQGLPCLWGSALSGNGHWGGFTLFSGAAGLTALQDLIPVPACSVEMNPANATRYKNSNTALPAAALPGTTGGFMVDVPYEFVQGDGFQYSGSGGVNSGLRTRQPYRSTAYPPCPHIGGASTQGTNTTRYLGGIGRTSDAANALSGSAVESEMEFIPPPGKAKNLIAICDGNPPAGQTYTLTLRKNGAPTGITVQFTNASALVLSETATEVSFNGTTDVASIEGVTSVTAGTRIVNFTLGYYRA